MIARQMAVMQQYMTTQAVAGGGAAAGGEATIDVSGTAATNNQVTAAQPNIAG